MTSSAPIFGEGVVKRERFRRVRMSEDKRNEIVDRVLRFAQDDIDNRAEDRARRLQRYAKYRQWTEGKTYPWDNASDIALSDIAEASLNLQDTLSNAILSSRPVVGANALKVENADRERSINRILDYQFFVEQPGERIVEELAELFLVDGVFTAYIPWIRESRYSADVRIFDPIPEEEAPVSYFMGLIEQEFPGLDFFKLDDEGWDYRIAQDDPDLDDAMVKFYTRRSDRSVEMLIEREVSVFDGPRVIVKDYDDVLTPPRVANLQAPGPSNPGGAPHVILVDAPTVEEIEALKRSGYYNMPGSMSSDGEGDYDDDRLGLRTRDTSDEEAKEQKDVMGGVEDDTALDKEHATLTRFICFDVYDLNGDGKPEDVVWWVLKEDKVLLKAVSLSELFPANPPRRPLAETQFLPVKGRREGISLPELMEGTHDFLKEVLDHGMDGGTLATTPFFFYRAASSLKPEILRPWPGDGIPIADPQRDVYFPQIPFDGSFALNAFFTGRQLQERLTLVGDLQAGRVPQGKSSALRTAGGINTILAQGEARPERVLRRFFMGFAEIFRQMHELNQYFFPEQKQIRVLGMVEPGENAYPTIVRKADLEGRFLFDFRASILNASKIAKEQGLEKLLLSLVNPLMIQLGIANPDSIYRMVRDYAQSLGQDPDRYINEPTPGAGKSRITANEAISVIFDHMLPDGLPAEAGGAQEHLDQLHGFMQDDRFGLLDESQINLFRSWLTQITQLSVAEEGQRKMAALASDFNQKLRIGAGGGGGNGKTPPQVEPQAPTMPGEMLDETLPSNGRGIT